MSAGLNNLCENKIVLGTQEWPGSFGEYIVAPAKVVYPLPDSLSYEEGVMVEPLAVGVHAVRWSEMGPGDNVLVLGGGHYWPRHHHGGPAGWRPADLRHGPSGLQPGQS